MPGVRTSRAMTNCANLLPSKASSLNFVDTLLPVALAPAPEVGAKFIAPMPSGEDAEAEAHAETETVEAEAVVASASSARPSSLTLTSPSFASSITTAAPTLPPAPFASTASDTLLAALATVAFAVASGTSSSVSVAEAAAAVREQEDEEADLEG